MCFWLCCTRILNCWGGEMSDPREQCEWYEVERAIVGNRVIKTWCSNPDNSGGDCNYTVCPVVEDINEEN